jgi:hypothetical protein
MTNIIKISAIEVHTRSKEYSLKDSIVAEICLSISGLGCFAGFRLISKDSENVLKAPTYPVVNDGVISQLPVFNGEIGEVLSKAIWEAILYIKDTQGFKFNKIYTYIIETKEVKVIDRV